MDDNMITKHQKAQHADRLRKGRFSEQYGLYFLSKCTHNHYILTPGQRYDVVEAFLHFRKKGAIYLHAFIVMPDHWHALLSLRNNVELSLLVGKLNRYAGYPSRKSGQPIKWQRAFHDHKIRESESVVDVVKYVESNPLRSELVDTAEDWDWSSANAKYRDELDREFLGFERWEERD